MTLLAPAYQISRRILIVDDYFMTARSMAVLLETCGCTAEVVFDPAKTLEVVDKFEPEVVLLDLEVPGVDTFELARAIKRRRQPPVIAAWTAHDQRHYREQAEAAGFDRYLVKPTTVVDLLELLSQDAPAPRLKQREPRQ